MEKLKWFNHPKIYEINTWPWLHFLSEKYKEKITLINIPNEVFDKEQPLGLRHLGIRVNNMDEAMAHFKAQGVEFVSGPVEFKPKIYATADVSSEKLLRALKPREGKTFWRISMFRDPNGVILELLER